MLLVKGTESACNVSVHLDMSWPWITISKENISRLINPLNDVSCFPTFVIPSQDWLNVKTKVFNLVMQISQIMAHLCKPFK